MSLLDEFMSETGKCVILDKRTASDGLGGYTPTYVEGAEFEAIVAVLGNQFIIRIGI